MSGRSKPSCSPTRSTCPATPTRRPTRSGPRSGRTPGSRPWPAAWGAQAVQQACVTHTVMGPRGPAALRCWARCGARWRAVCPPAQARLLRQPERVLVRALDFVAVAVRARDDAGAVAVRALVHEDGLVRAAEVVHEREALRQLRQHARTRHVTIMRPPPPAAAAGSALRPPAAAHADGGARAAMHRRTAPRPTPTVPTPRHPALPRPPPLTQMTFWIHQVSSLSGRARMMSM